MGFSAKIAAERALSWRQAIIADCQSRKSELAALARAPWESVSDAVADIEAIGLTLPHAQIVLWTEDMLRVSGRGAQRAFDGIVAPDFDETERPEWWVFSGFTLIQDTDVLIDLGLPSDARICSELLIPMPGRLVCCTGYYAPSNGNIMTFRVGQISSGITVGTEMDLTILAGREFMRSEIAAKEPIKPERAVRRRCEKRGVNLPDIRLVAFRRSTSASRENASMREYLHQWLVQGHWRHLREPRKSDGSQITWVRPHVKGPEGAPLLQPRESIHVVVR